MTQSLALIVIALGLSACSMLQRNPTSGYSSWNDDVGTYTARNNVDHPGTANYGSSADDTPTRVLSPSQRVALEEKLELRSLEASLTESERYQYFRFKPMMNSDRERVEFLRIRDPKARARWFYNRNKNSGMDKNVASAIQDGDVMLGMPRQAVRESWGDPDEVEVAGSTNNGNERWRYKRFIASPEGYQEEERLIYFEGGQVSGWQRQ